MSEAVAGLIDDLAQRAYLADRGLATAVHLARSLARPLLLEGDAGVGKTELAKVLAALTGAELVRLQCHEGLDRGQALYSWDHARQILHLRAMEASGERPADHVDTLYGERFLIERPLLRALRAGSGAVLLIDEIDRADDEFEAFLLELLADGQVTIPELGTVTAATMPLVILTSNRTRELSDALKRRCLYHWIDHPDPAREVAIVRARAPEVPAEVARRVATLVARLRSMDLYKPPGVAEAIDWARVLAALTSQASGSSAAGSAGVPPTASDGAINPDRPASTELDPSADDGLGRGAVERDTSRIEVERILETLGVVIKDHDDLVRVRAEIDAVLAP